MASKRTIYIILVSTILVFFLYLAANQQLFLTHLNQLDIEVERRIQWWDWQDSPEEVLCRASHAHGHRASTKAIPNVVHFIMVAEEGQQVELSYAHYLAVKAAIVRMQATDIRLHTYGLDLQNTWWLALQDHVTLVEIDPHEPIPYGLSLQGLLLPHQVDILRLAILLRDGGIYLDIDVFALKPFTELLENPRDTIMGHEGGNRYGLCNAVIVSRPGSTFLAKWLQSYRTFNPHAWNEHSVRKPKQLQIQFPGLLCPLSPTVFFWPTWAKKHVQYMHEKISQDEASDLRANLTTFHGSMYENQLAFHAVAAKDHLRNLTADHVRDVDTRFNVLLRDISTAPL